jgi:signal transduction histidine kinase
VRVFGLLALLLVGATATGLVLQRAVLRAQLDEQADLDHDQELDELRRLASGRNPRTGEPFGGDVASVFEVFLSRNVPNADEVYVTLIDGRPFRSSLAPVQLDEDRELVQRWAALTSGQRGSAQTEGGEVRWLAAPLEADGEVLATFVVATFLDPQRQAIDDALRVEGLVALGVVAVALAVAWAVAGRLLRPVRDLTDNARALDERDLSARIPVTGDDEIAELARTYNAMLDRLQTAFDTQRRFLDDAGHELRTPITIVGGHLELMGDDPDDRRETLALVTDELDRMARLVDDLLTLAKVEQPQFVERRPTDLARLTEGLVERAALVGAQRWQLDASAHGWWLVDDQRLIQASLNLIRNVVDHTEPDTAAAIGSRVEGDRLEIWVRDEGPGIAVLDQDRLFERFARGAKGTRADGAGLGLAIVRAIAEGHGGTVSVQSEPGAGTRFTITVPAQPAPAMGAEGPDAVRI